MRSTRLVALVVLVIGILVSTDARVAVVTPQAITLTPTASPMAGQPGVHQISLTGSGFPSGTITPAAITISLQPSLSGAGPSGTAPAVSVTTIAGSTRRVTFLVPATWVVAAPVAYQIGFSGATTTGSAFQTQNTSTLLVNPPAALTSVSPSVGLQGAALTVTLTAVYTNFVQGSAQASFGAGIAVGGGAPGAFGPVTMLSPTQAVAQLTIDPGAALGPRTVQIRTGAQAASAADAFAVAGPTVSALDPARLTLAANGTGTLTVTLINPDLQHPMAVALTSGDPSIVSVPTDVVIPAGGTAGVIPVTGGIAGGPVAITARLNGSAATAEVTVRDRPLPPTVTVPLVEGMTIVTGVGTADAIVDVQVNGAPAGAGSAGSDGHFAIPVAPLVAGQVVRTTQTAGGLASLLSAPVIVQARPPAPTVMAPIIAGGTQVTGTAASSARIDVFVDGTPVATDGAAVDGSFSITVPLLVARQQITATQQVAGITSIPSAPVTVVAAPPPPSITSPLVSGGMTVTGGGTPGATIETGIDGNAAGTAIVNRGGTWTLALGSPLVTGQHVKARQTVSGVPSAFSADVIVVSRPPPPTLTTPLVDGAPSVGGSGVAGAIVTVSINAAVAGAAAVAGDGTWTVTLGPLIAGQVVTATQTVGGIESDPSPPVTVLARPPAPIVNSPLIEGGTGVSGSAVAGGTVAVFVGGNPAGTVTVDPFGAWTLVLGSPLVAGQQVQANQAVAGVVSGLSPPVIVLARPPAPTITLPLIAGEMTVSGAGIPGASVEMFANAGSIGTTAVGGGGTWTLPLSSALVAGQVITAQQTVGGIPSLLSAQFTVVGRPPAPTVVGPLFTGATTLSGGGIPGAAIQAFADGAPIGTTNVPTGGTWSLSLQIALVAGQVIVAHQTVAGVSSEPSPPLIVQADSGNALWGPIAGPIGRPGTGSGGVGCQGAISSSEPLVPHGAVTLDRSGNQLTVTVNLHDGDPGRSYTIEISEAAPTCLSDDLANTGVVLTADALGNGQAQVVLTLPKATPGFATIGDGLGTEQIIVVLDWTHSTTQFGDRFATHAMPLPTVGNRAPIAADDTYTVASGDTSVGLPEGFSAQPVASAGFEAISVIALDERTNELYVGDKYGSSPARLSKVDLATREVSRLPFNTLITDPDGLIIGDGRPLTGFDIVLADENSVETSACCDGRVFRINRSTGAASVIARGAGGTGPVTGDPAGLALGRGEAFGTYLYVMDFQGASPNPPVLYRVDANKNSSAFVVSPNLWTVNQFPEFLDFADGTTQAFAADLFVGDPGDIVTLDLAKGPPTVWRVTAAGELSVFKRGPEIGRPARIHFAPPGAFGPALYFVDRMVPESPVLKRILPGGQVEVFATGQPQSSLPGGVPTAFVRDFAFTADGQVLYIAGEDKIIKIASNALSVPPPGVLVNDSDLDGDVLVSRLETSPLHGALTLAADGSFMYLPAAGFTGIDRFTYRANDGALDSNLASVTINVGSAPSPSLASVAPSSSQQGQSGALTIVGANTHFVQGITQVDLGPGVTVTSTAVTCATCLSAQVTIADGAATGPRTVTVTTGTEVVALVNGFTIQVGTPILTSISPTSGRQGQMFPVMIAGQFTHFTQGTTQVSFGPGLTVASLTVTSATTASAVITIDAAATIGGRPVTVTTGAEVASLADGFSVLAGTPTLLTINPAIGMQGQQNVSVAITGQFTHFVQNATTASFGSGVSVASLTVTSPTSATAAVNIDSAAAVGARTVTVTTGAEVASLGNAFTVTVFTVPSITLVSPNTGEQGSQNLAVSITGQFTHFTQGTTQASFGDGVAVGSGPAGGFGPVTVTGPSSATAHLDIAARPAWVQHDTGGPGPRKYRHTLTYDPVSNQLIVFGGDPDFHPNELWRLTNATGGDGPPSVWSLISASGSGPAGRGGSSAVYDAGSDRMIIFGGGCSSQLTNAVWILSNAAGRNGTPTWIAVSPTGSRPVPRWAHSAVYDPGSNRMIIYGGNACSSPELGDTWVLSNANGTGSTAPAWTQLVSTGATPGPRCCAALAYDAVNNRMMMFGGGNGSPADNVATRGPGEMWVLQNANGLGGPPQWTQLTPDGIVPPRSSAGAIAYDPQTNRLLIIASDGYLGPTIDTWVLEHANGLGGSPVWKELGPFPTLPAARYNYPNAGAAYDPGTDRLMLFGGLTSAVAPPFFNITASTDTWTLRGAIRSASVGSRTVTVQTGAEQVALPSGFTVTSSATNASAMLEPAFGPRGAVGLTVAITGDGTHFQQGLTQANFGPAVSVGGASSGSFGPISVTSSVTALAQVTIDPTAPIAMNPVIIQTGSEVVAPANGFFLTNDPAPALVSVTPVSGQRGQPLTVVLTGFHTHFAQGSTQVAFGGGVTVSSVTVGSPTSLTALIGVASGAVVGPRSITAATGTEVVALANGFAVIDGSAIPRISSTSPTQGQQGQQNLSVAITGQFTHWAQGTTTANFGAGITVTSLTVTSATAATAVINVDPTAAVGGRMITVTTGSEVTSSSAFVVTSGAALLSVSPGSARQGQENISVTIAGSLTHFQQGVTQASFGAGITVLSVTVAGPLAATAVISVDPSAATGPRVVTVATGAETAVLISGFSVLSGVPSLVSVNPATGQQGQTVTATISGQFTNFSQGVTQASFGAGLSVGGAASGELGAVTVTGPTTAIAEVTISERPDWARVVPTGTIPGRVYHTQVFDPVSKQLLVFGGLRANPGQHLNDVWRLTNANGIGSSTWTQAVPTGTPPSARAGMTSAYDPATDRMMVFGGFLGTTAPCLNDTWVLVNAAGRNGPPTWEQLNPQGEIPAVRWGHAMAYDPVNNRLIVEGGTNCFSFNDYGDVWVLSNANGLGGAPVWTQLAPTGPSPGTRTYNSVSYDQATNRLIMIGGRKDGAALGNFHPHDVWVLKNANGLGGTPEWIELLSSSAPIERNFYGAVYDSVTNRVLVETADCGNPKIWVLNHANGLGGPATFSALGPFETPPVPPLLSWMSYDPSSDRLITFGGFAKSGTNQDSQIGQSETWVLHSALRSGLPGPRPVTVTTSGEMLTLDDGFNVTMQPFAEPAVRLEPVCASPGGSQDVLISGIDTNFVDGITDANFGSGIAVGGVIGSFGPVQVLTPTTAMARIQVSGSATLGDRTVVVRTGAQQLRPVEPFTIMTVEGPILLSASPASVVPGETVTVTISGALTSFVAGTTQVDFGSGITTGTVTVLSPTSLQARISVDPLAATGARNVVVSTGSENVSLLGGVVVASGGRLVQVAPNAGQQGQSGVLTVVGSNTHFVQGTSQLSLGFGVTVSSVSVTCPTCLSAQVTIADDAATGPRAVTVTTGSDVTTLANGFTVQPGTPILTSLTPAAGRQGQSFPVTIGGKYTHFTQGTTQVSLGDGITVSNVVVASPTSLTAQLAIAPTAALGVRTVTVTTGTEVVSVDNVFTVTAAAALTKIDVVPNGTVTLTKGQTFQFSAKGTFSDASVQDPLPGATWSSDKPAIAPISSTGLATGLAAGVANIVASKSGIQSASTSFVVKPLPVGLFGPITAGATLVDGAAAEPAASVQVYVNGLPRGPTMVVNGAGEWTVTGLSPALVLGDSVTAFQTVNGVTSDVSSPIIVTPGTPVLLSVSPTTGLQGQQNLNLTITGQFTHFAQGVSAVSFAGTAITVNSVAVASLTSLTANISIALNALQAPRTVTVTTGTEVATLPNAFTVQAATNQAPTITIAPTWTVTIPNRLTLTYTVTDDGLPNGGMLTQSWEEVNPSGHVGFQDKTSTSISVGFDQAGTYVLRLTTTDTQFTVTRDVTVTVNPAPTTEPPTVSVATPTDGAEITGPITVIGTVQSPALASWALEFRLETEPAFHTIASGTTSVTNAALGTLDPTLLLNGLGLLQLRATDAVGQTSTVGPISVVISQNQKIGNFTVAFTDVSVPVAGLPIQVGRKYDSRDKGIGEFGVGWRLDLSTVSVSTNGVLGDNWTGTRSSGLFPSYCIQPSRSHLVTVTFGDGTVFQFQPTLDPACQELVQQTQVGIAFTPVSTTPSNVTLSLVTPVQPFVGGVFPGPLTLFDLDDATTFDPDLFRLTLPDGRALVISRAQGLQSERDLNGNTLTVSAAGIVHSSGKSVSFQRDGLHRITRVTDPAGHAIQYAYDGRGDLVSVTDAVGNVTTFTYNATHGLLTIQDPRGVQPIQNTYDDTGRLIQHTDAFGKTITYTHDLNARQEIVTDRLSHVTVNEYDIRGNVVLVTDAAGGVTARTYDASNNLLTETNPLGKTRSFTYDANDNRLIETDPLGKTTAYTYNSRNQVVTVTDALGRITTNAYDATGNLTSSRDADGKVTSYTYNARGLRTSTTDPLGQVTQYQYDASGNLTQQTDALGHATTYTYDANGNRLTESRTQATPSSAHLLVTQYRYDEQNRLTRTTFADGTTTQTTYNPIGKSDVTTDQLGRKTTYVYDLMGRLTSTGFPDGTSESASYDAEGQRITSTDRAGHITSYTYDAVKRLTATTFADGVTTSTTYDAAGQVARVTDARGGQTQYAYDDAGRRTLVTDAAGHGTSFGYDAVGNQTSMTDANGHATQYAYDATNRRVKTTYVDGTFEQTGFDALGRMASKRDQAGVVTQYQYDALGRLITVIDALGQHTSYGYDELGSRTSQIDANNHTIQFDYDGMGRRASRTLPLGMAEHFAYTATGNLASKTDFTGKTTTYTYDAMDRLVSKTPDPAFAAPAIQFSYSTNGQRTQMVDASGTTTYAYDLRDRLRTKATPQGTLTYTYNPAGNLASIRSSNSGGTSVDYAYDVLNRLSTVTDNRLSPGVTTYAYDNVGNLASFVAPNGVSHSYAYNALNRLTTLAVTDPASTTLASYSYTLGPSGNRTSVTELGGRRVDYTYDSLYRLTTEAISAAPGGTTTYGYDQVGNRLSRSSPTTGLAFYVYDANDRLSTDAYDDNGSTTASGGSAYTYDFENHLLSANGGAVTMVYDGDGSRVAKTAGGATTKYLVDDRNLTGYAQVLEELSNDAVQRHYTYGLNRISETQTSGTTFYGYDGHGSVRLVIDITGGVTNRYDYDSFGGVLTSSELVSNSFRYSGEELDSDLALYNLRTRYYAPNAGRFLTRDWYGGSITEPLSLHSYLYGGANPINNHDPSGGFAIELIIPTLINSLISIQSVHSAPGLLQANLANETCGPAIDRELNTLLARVEQTFRAASSAEKCVGCANLVNLPAAARAWDIGALVNSEGTGGAYPFYFASQADFERSTASVSGKCFARGAVNYALFGRAQRLCSDQYAGDPITRAQHSLAATLSLVDTYRTWFPDVRLRHLLTTPFWQRAFLPQALAFGEAGWTGSLTSAGSEFNSKASDKSEPSWDSNFWRWQGIHEPY